MESLSFSPERALIALVAWVAVMAVARHLVVSRVRAGALLPRAGGILLGAAMASAPWLFLVLGAVSVGVLPVVLISLFSGVPLAIQSASLLTADRERFKKDGV